MNIFDRVASGVSQKALQEAKARTPTSVQRYLPLARKLLFQGPEGLVNAGLDELLERFGVIGGPGTRLPRSTGAIYQPSELIGGITLKRAREMFQRHIETDFAKKNLWCIRVTNVSGGDPFDINLFATDVSYSGFQVTGQPVPVGSGSFDTVTTSEPREVRVTTMDDTAGTVKLWFEERHNRMCKPDGTFGLPLDFVFRVDIMHAFIGEEAIGSGEAFWDSYIMRPGSIEYDLSRREDGMQEITMSFQQFDTFAALV